MEIWIIHRIGPFPGKLRAIVPISLRLMELGPASATMAKEATLDS
jgi:hypothetical protein